MNASENAPANAPEYGRRTSSSDGAVPFKQAKTCVFKSLSKSTNFVHGIVTTCIFQRHEIFQEIRFFKRSDFQESCSPEDFVSQTTFQNSTSSSAQVLSTSCAHQVALESTTFSLIASMAEENCCSRRGAHPTCQVLWHSRTCIFQFLICRQIRLHSNNLQLSTQFTLTVPLCFLHCSFHFVQTSVMKQRFCELMSANGHRLVMRGDWGVGSARDTEDSGVVWSC